VTDPDLPHPSNAQGLPGGVDDVTPGAAARLLSAEAVIVLDVREDDEWNAGHIDGARHIPLAQLDPLIPDALGLTPGTPIVVVCRSGNRSARAAAALRTAGPAVHNMTGGMNAWAAEGLPVVTAGGAPGTIQ
jgi:rhodanese-related sulfurtransferase